MARASSTSRRCPVERSPARDAASVSIPHHSIDVRDRSATWRRSRRPPEIWLHGRRAAKKASGPRATFSATVMESNSSIRWNVLPSPCAARPGVDR